MVRRQDSLGVTVNSMTSLAGALLLSALLYLALRILLPQNSQAVEVGTSLNPSWL